MHTGKKYDIWSSDKIRSSDSRDRPGAVETDNMAYQNRVVDRSPEASRRKLSTSSDVGNGTTIVVQKS